MPLTRDFKDTIRERAQRDPEFRGALLAEAAQALLAGEPDVTKAVLRDYVNATVGFEELSRQVRIPKKSLMRMLSKSGNPTLDSMTAILASLQKHEGREFVVSF